MKLIANRQLTGHYGTVAPHAVFECDDAVGTQLLANDLARKAAPPTVVYETQTLEPFEAPEVRPERPFRNVHLSNAEPETVATEGDSLVSDADVQASGTSNRGGRGGRSVPPAKIVAADSADPSE
jgi:hypothetical protein